VSSDLTDRSQLAPNAGASTRASNAGLGLIALAAVAVAAAELLFKLGADATADIPSVVGIFGVSILQSGWTWLGIGAYVASFVAWLQVLRHMPLHLAFGLMSIVHVLVPLGAWWFLGEIIDLRRWLGIGLVVLGVIVLAGPAMRADSSL
jgi:multidrug transporter EmrE-like cation transporter